MRFSEVVGQAKVKQRINNMIVSGRMPHALLISGAPGTGGLPVAMAVAQRLNCESPTENDSCGSCNSCLKAAKIIHPDIFYTYPTVVKKTGEKPVSADFATEWRKTITENPYITYNEWMDVINAETKQGNITANECQEIVRRISLKNYESRYKVQIIWLAELLKETGNVLLKSLEEPPAGTVFILVTEQPEMILNTILSRTQMLRLPLVETEAIAAELEKHVDFEMRDKVNQLAELANGNWVTALEIALNEQVESEAIFLNWLRLCAVRLTGQGAQNLIAWVDEFNEMGREKQKMLLRYGLLFFENCIRELAAGDNRLRGDSLQASKKIVARYPIETLSEIENIINKFHYRIERNASAKITGLSMSLKVNELLTAS